LSRKARQDVRRALAEAERANLYSVHLHGVVWTLRIDKVQPPKEQPSQPQGVAASSRSERSAKRLLVYQKAIRNWLAKFFGHWQRLKQLRPSSNLLPPPGAPASSNPLAPAQLAQPPAPVPAQQAARAAGALLALLHQQAVEAAPSSEAAIDEAVGMDGVSDRGKRRAASEASAAPADNSAASIPGHSFNPLSLSLPQDGSAPGRPGGKRASRRSGTVNQRIEAALSEAEARGLAEARADVHETANLVADVLSVPRSDVWEKMMHCEGEVDRMEGERGCVRTEVYKLRRRKAWLEHYVDRKLEDGATLRLRL
jgi:hypothetical protein